MRTPMIPGARERSALTVSRPPHPASPENDAAQSGAMDARTTLERRKEGGGGSGQPSTRP
jgi:hypothetical protein